MCGWADQPRACSGLVYDAFAKTADECRRRCCEDTKCSVWQFGPPLQCCGGDQCWRGTPSQCVGPEDEHVKGMKTAQAYEAEGGDGEDPAEDDPSEGRVAQRLGIGTIAIVAIAISACLLIAALTAFAIRRAETRDALRRRFGAIRPSECGCRRHDVLALDMSVSKLGEPMDVLQANGRCCAHGSLGRTVRI